ncbi:DUF1385 domain-containing protein [Candidatus Woesearchaeota archaeon]|nr:DUF1385 domain-containing protein [Candidatus Woesearchaeota archaeon]
MASGERKKAKDELLLVGGQAVIEGVLMRSRERTAVAVRTESGRVVKKVWRISPLSARVRLFKFPVVRGVGVLYETLSIGFKALTFSANAAAGKDEKGKDVLGKREMFLSFAVAIILAVSLFIVAPLFLAKLLTKGSSHTLLFNLVDGIFRLLAFLAYLVFISFFRDVQRLFQYHGAEHMTIHAYEHHDPLLPVKIRKYPTMHPRCGTSFLLIVILLSILVFSLVNPEGFILKLLSRILLLPVIAGVAYELLRLGAKFEKNAFMRLLVFPGLLLQRITTKEPDNSQIVVAVAALKAVLRVR